MEQHAQSIRQFSLGVITGANALDSCSFDAREQYQRSGTAIQLYFSEARSVNGERKRSRLKKMSVLAALEFSVIKKLTTRESGQDTVALLRDLRCMAGGSQGKGGDERNRITKPY